MDHLHRLHELFRQFPGIGPRQARRFTYFLLSSSEGYRQSLAKEITELASRVTVCTSCYRFFDRRSGTATLCSVCADSSRDRSALMVVAKDVDLDAIEKSKVYGGYYFVLGNTLSLIDQDQDSKIRSQELIETVKRRAGEGLKEVILALSLNSEGEHTREHVEGLISPLVKDHGLKVTILGRGLSTGTELEYSDTETIRNALESRRQEIIA
jgi:recombination protein RecR